MMTDKSKKMSDEKIGFFKSENTFGFENYVEEKRCGEIDDEIENIFDDLRLIGNPQNQSLDEVLAKAIAMERKQMEKQSNEPDRNSSFVKNKSLAAGFRQLQLREGIFCLLLTIMALLIMNLPNSFDDANLQRADLRSETTCWKCY